MGVAVIAGLTVATVLTLVVMPVTYHTLDEFTGLAVSLPRAASSAPPCGASALWPARRESVTRQAVRALSS